MIDSLENQQGKRKTIQIKKKYYQATGSKPSSVKPRFSRALSWIDIRPRARRLLLGLKMCLSSWLPSLPEAKQPTAGASEWAQIRVGAKNQWIIEPVYLDHMKKHIYIYIKLWGFINQHSVLGFHPSQLEDCVHEHIFEQDGKGSPGRNPPRKPGHPKHPQFTNVQSHHYDFRSIPSGRFLLPCEM